MAISVPLSLLVTLSDTYFDVSTIGFEDCKLLQNTLQLNLVSTTSSEIRVFKNEASAEIIVAMKSKTETRIVSNGVLFLCVV